MEWCDPFSYIPFICFFWATSHGSVLAHPFLPQLVYQVDLEGRPFLVWIHTELDLKLQTLPFLPLLKAGWSFCSLWSYSSSFRVRRIIFTCLNASNSQVLSTPLSFTMRPWCSPQALAAQADMVRHPHVGFFFFHGLWPLCSAFRASRHNPTSRRAETNF